MRLLRPLRLVSLAACLLAAGPARAQLDATTRAAARDLGHKAIALYEKGDFAGALDGFSRAHALVNLPTTGLWRARSLAKRGRLVEASEQYLEVTRMTIRDDVAQENRGVHEKAKKSARTEQAELQPRIPKVRITLIGKMPKDMVVELDGKPVPRALIGVQQPVDPGAHKLVVRGAGTSSEQTFLIDERATLDIPLQLVNRALVDPLPEERDNAQGIVWQVPVGWAAIGLGGASLLVGGISGSLATSKKDALETNCPGGQCAPPFHGDVDSFLMLRTLSTATFIAGGVLAAGGISLLVLAPRNEAAHGRRGVHLALAPASISLGGTF